MNKTRFKCEVKKGCNFIEGHKHCTGCGEGYFPHIEDSEDMTYCGICRMEL